VAEPTREGDRIWWRGAEFDHMRDRGDDSSVGGTAPELKPKGWDRASFDLNTHPIHPIRDLTREDLMIPSAGGRLTLLAACLACGACLAVLWVYFPLFFVQIVADVDLGVWVWVSMVTVAATGGLGLFLYASARERRYSETL
jgi:hypothetical protein